MSDDCACLYASEDGDTPQFFSMRTVTARKAHVCYECRREIVAGSQYAHISGKWDDGIATFRTCLDCVEIRKALHCDNEFVLGVLWEDIEDQIFREHGLTIACVDKLRTPEAKRLLQQRWMQFVERRA